MLRLISRYVNVLLVVSSVAFVVAASASAIPTVPWLILMITTFLLTVVANAIRANTHSLRQNVIVSGAVGSGAALLLVLIFAAYSLGGEDAFFEAHLFGRPVPWWVAVSIVITGFFLTFAVSAALGHAIRAKFLRRTVTPSNRPI
jgi:hypothetical protein